MAEDSFDWGWVTTPNADIQYKDYIIASVVRQLQQSPNELSPPENLEKVLQDMIVVCKAPLCGNN